MTETDWLNLMIQVGSNPALAQELLGADVNEGNFIERMSAIKERKKRALADLRYRALKAHNGTITMKDVKAMSQQQLVEEYEYICRRLEKDRFQLVFLLLQLILLMILILLVVVLLILLVVHLVPQFLDSDEDKQIGVSRVAADPDSDDDVLAEIIFR
ncbi:hypothetical protein Tco_0126196, partial [Tanacetum coccineum]